VLEAGLFGLLGQASLILGAWLSLQFAVPRQWLGLITGFGGGTLVAAAAFELSVPAYQEAGGPVTGLWLALGAITFYVADRAVARRAPKGEHASTGIALGALLDGVPESIAIAISMISGSTVSAAMLVAVLISNLPEGMASTPGFIRAGWTRRRALGLWLGIAVIGGLAAALGYAVLGDASGAVLGAVQAFAAGTILTMLASVMMPTAYADGKEPVGLAFVFGFAMLAFLTTLGT
jgi:ZIP family zinc transporter